MLPFVDSLAIDIRFSASGKELLVLYSDGRLLEFDVTSNSYSEWCKRCSMGSQWPAKNTETGPIGIAASPANDPRGVIMYGDDKIAFVAKSVSQDFEDWSG